jgi:hypothetical protein
MICNLCCACAFHEVETSERRLHYTDRRALIFGGQYPERGAQVLHQCIRDQAHWNARPRACGGLAEPKTVAANARPAFPFNVRGVNGRRYVRRLPHTHPQTAEGLHIEGLGEVQVRQGPGGLSRPPDAHRRMRHGSGENERAS